MTEEPIYVTTSNHWRAYLVIAEGVLFSGMMCYSMATGSFDLTTWLIFIPVILLVYFMQSEFYVRVHIYSDRLVINRPARLWGRNRNFLFSGVNRIELRDRPPTPRAMDAMAFYEGNKGESVYNFNSLSKADKEKITEVLLSLGVNIKYARQAGL